jgi:hypothetical protein
MKVSVIILSLLLAGCGTFSNLYMAMPSVEYCKEFSYVRSGTDIVVDMQCSTQDK